MIHIDGKQLNSLLSDLRKELRVELNLSDVDEEINVARIAWTEDSDKSPNKENSADAKKRRG